MARCSFLKIEGGGFFAKGERKCMILGTAIPEIRVTKYCEGDFFGCEIFREEMSKEKK